MEEKLEKKESEEKTRERMMRGMKVLRKKERNDEKRALTSVEPESINSNVVDVDGYEKKNSLFSSFPSLSLLPSFPLSSYYLSFFSFYSLRKE